MRLALAGLLLWAAPAFAGGCDKFADPLAYNACLAKAGPAARAAHFGAVPAGRAARAPRAVVARRGRSEMVFTPRAQ